MDKCPFIAVDLNVPIPSSGIFPPTARRFGTKPPVQRAWMKRNPIFLHPAFTYFGASGICVVKSPPTVRAAWLVWRNMFLFRPAPAEKLYSDPNQSHLIKSLSAPLFLRAMV